MPKILQPIAAKAEKLRSVNSDILKKVVLTPRQASMAGRIHSSVGEKIQNKLTKKGQMLIQSESDRGFKEEEEQDSETTFPNNRRVSSVTEKPESNTWLNHSLI